MKKIISAEIHGIIDYLVVAFLWLAPFVFELSNFISMIVYCLGGVHLLLTLLTNFKYGAFKVIPLGLHSGIEFVVGVVLILSPSVISGFPDVHTGLDKFFLGGFGLAVLITWVMTDYTEED